MFNDTDFTIQFTGQQTLEAIELVASCIDPHNTHRYNLARLCIQRLPGESKFLFIASDGARMFTAEVIALNVTGSFEVGRQVFLEPKLAKRIKGCLLTIDQERRQGTVTWSRSVKGKLYAETGVDLTANGGRWPKCLDILDNAFRAMESPHWILNRGDVQKLVNEVVEDRCNYRFQFNGELSCKRAPRVFRPGVKFQYTGQEDRDMTVLLDPKFLKKLAGFKDPRKTEKKDDNLRIWQRKTNDPVVIKLDEWREFRAIIMPIMPINTTDE